MKTAFSVSTLTLAALLTCTAALAETAQQPPAMPAQPAAPAPAAAPAQPAAQPAAAPSEPAKPAMHMATLSRRKIEEIQAALKDAGEAVEIDGNWSAETKKALADFQSKNGLKVTHRFDHETAKRLKVPSWTS